MGLKILNFYNEIQAPLFPKDLRYADCIKGYCLIFIQKTFFPEETNHFRTVELQTAKYDLY